MKEVICIHIGKGGVQIGDSLWELFCIEHHIQPDGQLTKECINSDDSFKSFFKESSTSNFVPRSLFLDLEPAATDEVRTGTRRQLYEPSQFVSGKEDAGSNFARGRYTAGKEIIDTAMDRIRKLAEDCYSLEGFIMFNSMGGGTGSGLGSVVLERLSADYGKKSRIGISVYPSSQLSYSPTESYNAVFASQFLLEHQDNTLVFENEALVRICQKILDIETPTHKNLNRLITNIVSCATAYERFGGGQANNTLQLATGFEPYPRFHFKVCSYSPFWPIEKTYCWPHSAEELTFAAFHPENLAATCNPRYGIYMGTSTLYRGDFTPKEINSSVAALRATNIVKFVDWVPRDFKVAVNYVPSGYVPDDILSRMWRSVCTISNSTALREVFERYLQSFNKMFTKRAFLHWYLREGAEEGDFNTAAEEVANLIADYEEVEASHGEIDAEEGEEKKQFN